MPVEEYHLLMLNSCVAATLCMTIISTILAHKEMDYGVTWPFMFAVLLFSGAWFFVLVYITLPVDEVIILSTKGFLLAGFVFFVIGVLGFIKSLRLFNRLEEIGVNKTSKLKKSE